MRNYKTTARSVIGKTFCLSIADKLECIDFSAHWNQFDFTFFKASIFIASFAHSTLAEFYFHSWAGRNLLPMIESFPSLSHNCRTYFSTTRKISSCHRESLKQYPSECHLSRISNRLNTLPSLNFVI